MFVFIAFGCLAWLLCLTLKGVFSLLNSGVKVIVKSSTPLNLKKNVNVSLDDQKFLS